VSWHLSLLMCVLWHLSQC